MWSSCSKVFCKLNKAYAQEIYSKQTILGNPHDQHIKAFLMILNLKEEQVIQLKTINYGNLAYLNLEI